METFSWLSIMFFCLFAVFVSNQQRHHQTFNGSSQGFYFALSLSFGLSMLTGLIYLFYLEFVVTWWIPLVALMLGQLSMVIAVFAIPIEPFDISLIGFVAWPVCAYLMFSVAK